MEFMHNIYAQFNNTVQRKFGMSCVDTNSGSVIVFNETVSDPAKASISSSSIPFVFPNQQWKLEDGTEIVCMDGGTVWNINMATAA